MQKQKSKKRNIRIVDRSRKHFEPNEFTRFQIMLTRYDQKRIGVLARSNFIPHLQTVDAISATILHHALNAIERVSGKKILADYIGEKIDLDVNELLREKEGKHV